MTKFFPNSKIALLLLSLFTFLVMLLMPTVGIASNITSEATQQTITPGVESCLSDSIQQFYAIWNGDLQTQLGCPAVSQSQGAAATHPTTLSYQRFERGFMIWAQSTSPSSASSAIFAVTNNGSFQRFEGNGRSVSSAANNFRTTPPSGLISPTLGFGAVWRANEDIRSSLGWAVAYEQHAEGSFQNFQRGLLILIPQTQQVVALVNETTSLAGMANLYYPVTPVYIPISPIAEPTKSPQINIPTTDPDTLPDHIVSTWWHDANGNYIEYCHLATQFTTAHLDRCFTTNALKSANKSAIEFAYLVGDSHGRNYYPAIVDALPEREVKYLTMGYKCSFLPSSMINAEIEQKTNCSGYMDSITKFFIEDAPNNSIIFIGQALYEYPERLSVTNFVNMLNFAREVADKNIKVVVLDATAPPPTHPRDCISALPQTIPLNSPEGCFRTKQDAQSIYRRFDVLAEWLESVESNVAYAPLRTGLCQGQYCGQYLSDLTPIYHDVGHITEDASRHLSTLLRSILESKSVLPEEQRR